MRGKQTPAAQDDMGVDSDHFGGDGTTAIMVIDSEEELIPHLASDSEDSCTSQADMSDDDDDEELVGCSEQRGKARSWKIPSAKKARGQGREQSEADPPPAQLRSVAGNKYTEVHLPLRCFISLLLCFLCRIRCIF